MSQPFDPAVPPPPGEVERLMVAVLVEDEVTVRQMVLESLQPAVLVGAALFGVAGLVDLDHGDARLFLQEMGVTPTPTRAPRHSQKGAS